MWYWSICWWLSIISLLFHHFARWHWQKNSFENQLSQLSLPEKVVAFQCACLSNIFMNIWMAFIIIPPGKLSVGEKKKMWCRLCVDKPLALTLLSLTLCADSLLRGRESITDASIRNTVVMLIPGWADLNIININPLKTKNCCIWLPYNELVAFHGVCHVVTTLFLQQPRMDKPNLRGPLCVFSRDILISILERLSPTHWTFNREAVTVKICLDCILVWAQPKISIYITVANLHTFEFKREKSICC